MLGNQDQFIGAKHSAIITVANKVTSVFTGTRAALLPLAPSTILPLATFRKVANANLPDEVGQGEGQATHGCLMTDKVYRPLMDGTQYDMYKKAAEDIPQWVQRLTREEYLQAVPGSDTKCLGGERNGY